MSPIFKQNGIILISGILSILNFGLANATDEYNIVERKAAQKNYTDEEDGKVLPGRTFLETWEIVLICVFVVIFVVLVSLCCIYVYCFGWVLPECIRKRLRDPKDEEYEQVQRLHRERKVSEIWQTRQYQKPPRNAAYSV